MAAGRQVNEDVDEKESVVRMVGCSPDASLRRTAKPQTRVWSTQHLPIPRADSAISRIWPIGSEARIV